MLVEYMITIWIELKDLHTVDFFSQNLHATHTNLAKSSGGPSVAAELRGDGPVVEHLATGTEAVNRRMARRLDDRYCSPGQGEHITSLS